MLVVVDRTELEGQLKRWVERLLGEMQQREIAVWPARNKDELRDLLETDKRGLILSMIHKYFLTSRATLTSEPWGLATSCLPA